MLAFDRDSSTHLLSWLKILALVLCHMWLTDCLIILQGCTWIHYIDDGMPIGSRELKIAGTRDVLHDSNLQHSKIKNPWKYKIPSHYKSYAFSRLECVKVFSLMSQKDILSFTNNHREGGTIFAGPLFILEAAFIISFFPAPVHLPSDWESCQVWFMLRAKRFSS